MAKRTKPTPDTEDTPAQDDEPGGTPQTANLDGRGKYRRQLEKFTLLTDDEKHRALKETWKEVAMVAASRAKQFAATCAPKDFGRLYQLIMSGAVSIDKAFPKTEQLNSPSLVVNMFGTLGQRAARIAIPPTPETITVTATEVPTPCLSTSKTPKETSSLIVTEVPSPTPMPSEPSSTATVSPLNS